MRLRVRLFGPLAGEAGMEEAFLELEPPATPATLWDELCRRHPGLALHAGPRLIAVNLDYADAERVLAEGDEVAFFPPVSGG